MHGETVSITKEQIAQIRERMQSLVRQDKRIVKETHSLSEALDLFEERGQYDKLALFHYRCSSNVNLYRLLDESDYFYGGMLPSVGKLRWFDLAPYEDGILLITPRRTPNHELRTFAKQPKLLVFFSNLSSGGVFCRLKMWARSIL